MTAFIKEVVGATQAAHAGKIEFASEFSEEIANLGPVLTYGNILRIGLEGLLSQAIARSGITKILVTASLTNNGGLKVVVRDYRAGAESADLQGMLFFKGLIESVGGSMTMAIKSDQGGVAAFILPVDATLKAIKRPVLNTPIIVAISGLRGSGRRVVARWLASRIGLRYVSGGFLMRAWIYKLLEEKEALGIDLNDQEAIARYAEKFLKEKRIDFTVEPIRVDGVDITTQDRTGSALRDKIYAAIDNNKENTAWLHRLSSYPSVQTVLESFIKALAARTKDTQEYNGVIIRSTEPSSNDKYINIVLNAPAEIRARRLGLPAEEIEQLDTMTKREDLVALFLNIKRIYTFDVESGADKKVEEVCGQAVEYIDTILVAARDLGQAVAKDDQQILEEVIRLFKENNPQGNERLIRDLYEAAKNKYGSKSFAAGQKYIEHALFVAKNVARWAGSEAPIAAVLLHKLSTQELKDLFSKKRGIQQLDRISEGFIAEIRAMIEKTAKVFEIPFLNDREVIGLKGRFTIQNMMNGIVQFAQDAPTLLLIFSEVLEALPVSPTKEEKLNQYQRLSFIYAPLAERLNATNIASDLRNEAFRILYPEEYRRIDEELEAIFGVSYEDIEREVENLRVKIARELREAGISFKYVHARVKSRYSIWEKIQSGRRAEYDSVLALKDIIGLRVVSDNIAAVLNFFEPWISQHFLIGVGAFVNIKKGFDRTKFNFLYRDKIPCELVLISSRDFALSEFGIIDETTLKAATPHWIAKLGKALREEGGVFTVDIKSLMPDAYVRQNFIADNIVFSSDFTENFRLLYDLIAGDIFVIYLGYGRGTLREKIWSVVSQKAVRQADLQVVRLPAGSVPADLAAYFEVNRLNSVYVGLEAVMAKQPLSETANLQTLATVALRAKGAAFNPSHEIERSAKTLRAKLLIRELRENAMSALEKKGREIVAPLAKAEKTELFNKKLIYFISSKHLEDIYELYAALGAGLIEPSELSNYLTTRIRRAVVIRALDREGLWYEVTHILHQYSLNIEKMEQENEAGLIVLRFQIEDTKDTEPFTNAALESKFRGLENVVDADVKLLKSVPRPGQASSPVEPLRHQQRIFIRALLDGLYGITQDISFKEANEIVREIVEEFRRSKISAQEALAYLNILKPTYRGKTAEVVRELAAKLHVELLWEALRRLDRKQFVEAQKILEKEYGFFVFPVFGREASEDLKEEWGVKNAEGALIDFMGSDEEGNIFFAQRFGFKNDFDEEDIFKVELSLTELIGDIRKHVSKGLGIFLLRRVKDEKAGLVFEAIALDNGSGYDIEKFFALGQTEDVQNGDAVDHTQKTSGRGHSLVAFFARDFEIRSQDKAFLQIDRVEAEVKSGAAEEIVGSFVRGLVPVSGTQKIVRIWSTKKSEEVATSVKEASSSPVKLHYPLSDFHGREVRWFGRIAVIELDQNKVIAVKFAAEGQTKEDLELEARLMTEALKIQPNGPLLLQSVRPGEAYVFEGDLPGLSADIKLSQEKWAIAFIALKEDFAYLHEKSPAITYLKIRKSGLFSILTLARFLKGGYVHTSLLSAIRLSGNILDLEHLTPVRPQHLDHDIGKVLSEWLHVIVLAGFVNGLSDIEVSEILLDGYEMFIQEFGGRVASEKDLAAAVMNFNFSQAVPMVIEAVKKSWNYGASSSPVSRLLERERFTSLRPSLQLVVARYVGLYREPLKIIRWQDAEAAGVPCVPFYKEVYERLSAELKSKKQEYKRIYIGGSDIVYLFLGLPRCGQFYYEVNIYAASNGNPAEFWMTIPILENGVEKTLYVNPESTVSLYGMVNRAAKHPEADAENALSDLRPNIFLKWNLVVLTREGFEFYAIDRRSEEDIKNHVLRLAVDNGLLGNYELIYNLIVAYRAVKESALPWRIDEASRALIIKSLKKLGSRKLGRVIKYVAENASINQGQGLDAGKEALRVFGREELGSVLSDEIASSPVENNGVPQKESLFKFIDFQLKRLPERQQHAYGEVKKISIFIETAFGMAKYAGLVPFLVGGLAGYPVLGAVVGVLVIHMTGISRIAVAFVYSRRYPDVSFARIPRPLTILPLFIGFGYSMWALTGMEHSFKNFRKLRNIAHKVRLSLFYSSSQEKGLNGTGLRILKENLYRVAEEVLLYQNQNLRKPKAAKLEFFRIRSTEFDEMKLHKYLAKGKSFLFIDSQERLQEIRRFLWEKIGRRYLGNIHYFDVEGFLAMVERSEKSEGEAFIKPMFPAARAASKGSRETGSSSPIDDASGSLPVIDKEVALDSKEEALTIRIAPLEEPELETIVPIHNEAWQGNFDITLPQAGEMLANNKGGHLVARNEASAIIASLWCVSLFAGSIEEIPGSLLKIMQTMRNRAKDNVWLHYAVAVRKDYRLKGFGPKISTALLISTTPLIEGMTRGTYSPMNGYGQFKDILTPEAYLLTTFRPVKQGADDINYLDYKVGPKMTFREFLASREVNPAQLTWSDYTQFIEHSNFPVEEYVRITKRSLACTAANMHVKNGARIIRVIKGGREGDIDSGENALITVYRDLLTQKPANNIEENNSTSSPLAGVDVDIVHLGSLKSERQRKIFYEAVAGINRSVQGPEGNWHEAYDAVLRYHFFSSEGRDRYLVFAEAARRMLGYCFFDHSEIDYMAVLKESRRLGLATEIMRLSLRHLDYRGVNRVLAMVHRDNGAMQDFFSNLEAKRVKPGIKVDFLGAHKNNADYYNYRIRGMSRPVATLKQGDIVIWVNHRADRSFGAMMAFTDSQFNQSGNRFDVKDLGLIYVPFVPYDKKYFESRGIRAVFESKFSLPSYMSVIEVLESAGVIQGYFGESDKGKHISYFFAGQRKLDYTGRGIKLSIVPSEGVADKDKKPEMKSKEIADNVLAFLGEIRARSRKKLIVVNLAVDIQGHNIKVDQERARLAVLAGDEAAGRIKDAVLAQGGVYIETADHGNIEQVVVLDDKGMPLTDKYGVIPFDQHTTNPVPFVIAGLGEKEAVRLKKGMGLSNIAPTLLDILGVPKPVEMAESLLADYVPQDIQGPVVLLIRDGWGINPFNNPEAKAWNGIELAQPPVYLDLIARYPFTTLKAHGDAVGLPDYQMGDSDNGHRTIGVGMIIETLYKQIIDQIGDGRFFDNSILRAVFQRAVQEGRNIHVMGLCSEGGIHADNRYFLGLIEMAKRLGLPENVRVNLWPILDGRDVMTRIPTQNGIFYIRQLEEKIKAAGLGNVRIAGTIGRNFAMDRDAVNLDQAADEKEALAAAGEGAEKEKLLVEALELRQTAAKRWHERFKLAYDLWTEGKGQAVRLSSSPIGDALPAGFCDVLGGYYPQGSIPYIEESFGSFVRARGIDAQALRHRLEDVRNVPGQHPFVYLEKVAEVLEEPVRKATLRKEEDFLKMGSMLIPPLDEDFANLAQRVRQDPRHIRGKDVEQLHLFIGEGCVLESLVGYLLLRMLGVEADVLLAKDHVTLGSQKQEIVIVIELSSPGITSAFSLREYFVRSGSYWHLRKEKQDDFFSLKCRAFQPKVRELYRYFHFGHYQALLATVLFNFATAYLSRGDLDKAVRYYSQAAKLDGDYAEAFINLSSIHHDMGDMDKALEYLNKAAAVDPASHLALNNTGSIFLQLDRPVDAIGYFLQAIALEPDFVQSYFGMGVAYGLLGNTEEAVKNFAVAVRKGMDKERLTDLPEGLQKAVHRALKNAAPSVSSPIEGSSINFLANAVDFSLYPEVILHNIVRVSGKEGLFKDVGEDLFLVLEIETSRRMGAIRALIASLDRKDAKLWKKMRSLLSFSDTIMEKLLLILEAADLSDAGKEKIRGALADWNKETEKTVKGIIDQVMNPDQAMFSFMTNEATEGFRLRIILNLLSYDFPLPFIPEGPVDAPKGVHLALISKGIRTDNRMSILAGAQKYKGGKLFLVHPDWAQIMELPYGIKVVTARAAFYLDDDGRFVLAGFKEPIILHYVGGPGVWSAQNLRSLKIPTLNNLLPIIRDKMVVDEILKDAGVRIPNSLFISRQEETSLDQLRTFFDIAGKTVVKPRFGISGRGIMFVSPGDDLQANGLLNALMDSVDVIVQKFILHRKLVRAGKELDWNVRVFTSRVPQGEIKVSGHVVRIGSGAVNLSIDAEPDQLKVVLQDLGYGARIKEIIRRIEEEAVKAHHAVEDYTKKFPPSFVETPLGNVSPYFEDDHLGIDIILGEDVLPYVIEVNGSPGGIYAFDKVAAPAERSHAVSDFIRNAIHKGALYKNAVERILGQKAETVSPAGKVVVLAQDTVLSGHLPKGYDFKDSWVGRLLLSYFDAENDKLKINKQFSSSSPVAGVEAEWKAAVTKTVARLGISGEESLVRMFRQDDLRAHYHLRWIVAEGIVKMLASMSFGHGIRKAWINGGMSSGDFTPGSDIDLIIEVETEAAKESVKAHSGALDRFVTEKFNRIKGEARASYPYVVDAKAFLTVEAAADSKIASLAHSVHYPAILIYERQASSPSASLEESSSSPVVNPGKMFWANMAVAALLSVSSASADAAVAGKPMTHQIVRTLETLKIGHAKSAAKEASKVSPEFKALIEEIIAFRNSARNLEKREKKYVGDVNTTLDSLFVSGRPFGAAVFLPEEFSARYYLLAAERDSLARIYGLLLARANKYFSQQGIVLYVPQVPQGSRRLSDIGTELRNEFDKPPRKSKSKEPSDEEDAEEAGSSPIQNNEIFSKDEPRAQYFFEGTCRLNLKLIEASREEEKIAAGIGALNAAAEDLARLMMRRGESPQQRVGFDAKTQRLWVVRGLNVRYALSEGASVVYRVYKPVHHDLFWEAFRSMDDQIRTEGRELNWLRSVYKTLSDINKNMDEAIAKTASSGDQPEILAEEVSRMQAELAQIREKLDRAVLGIKDIIRLSLDLAMALNSRGEFRASRSILGVALRFVTIRGQAVRRIIEKIREGRMSQMREITFARNREMLGRLDKILQALDKKDLRAAYGKVQGFLRAEKLTICFREPEFKSLKGLLGFSGKLIKDGNSESARNVLEEAREKVLDALTLAVFMEDFRNLCIAAYLCSSQLSEEELFARAFDNFLRSQKIEKTSAEASLWGTRLYQAAFISLNIDNPEKKSERIPNPAFEAVVELVGIKEAREFKPLKSSKKYSVSKIKKLQTHELGWSAFSPEEKRILGIPLLIEHFRFQGRKNYFSLVRGETDVLLEVLAVGHNLSEEDKAQLLKAAYVSEGAQVSSPVDAMIGQVLGSLEESIFSAADREKIGHWAQTKDPGRLLEPALMHKIFTFLIFSYQRGGRYEGKRHIHYWTILLSTVWGLDSQAVRFMFDWLNKYVRMSQLSPEALDRFLKFYIVSYRTHPHLKQKFAYLVPQDSADDSKIDWMTGYADRVIRSYSNDFMANRTFLRSCINETPYFLGLRFGLGESTFGVEILLGEQRMSANPLSGVFFRIGVDGQASTLRNHRLGGVRGATNGEVADFFAKVGLMPSEALLVSAVEYARRHEFSELLGVNPKFHPTFKNGKSSMPYMMIYNRFGLRRAGNPLGPWNTVEGLTARLAKKAESSPEIGRGVTLMRLAFADLRELGFGTYRLENEGASSSPINDREVAKALRAIDSGFENRDFSSKRFLAKVDGLFLYDREGSDQVHSFVHRAVLEMARALQKGRRNHHVVLGLAGEISGLHEVIVERDVILRQINLGRLRSINRKVYDGDGEVVKQFDAISDNTVFEFKFHLTLARLYQQVIGINLRESEPHLEVLVDYPEFSGIRNIVYFGEADGGYMAEAIKIFIQARQDRPQFISRAGLNGRNSLTIKLPLPRLKEFLFSKDTIRLTMQEEAKRRKRFLPWNFVLKHSETEGLIDRKIGQLRGERFDVIIALSNAPVEQVREIKRTRDRFRRSSSSPIGNDQQQEVFEKLRMSLRNNSVEEARETLDRLKKIIDARLLSALLDILFDEQIDSASHHGLMMEIASLVDSLKSKRFSSWFKLRMWPVMFSEIAPLQEQYPYFFDEGQGVYAHLKQRIIPMLKDVSLRTTVRGHSAGGVSFYKDGAKFFEAFQALILFMEAGVSPGKIEILVTHVNLLALLQGKRGFYGLEWFVRNDRTLGQNDKMRIKKYFEFTADGRLRVKKYIRERIATKHVSLVKFRIKDSEPHFHFVLYNFNEYKVELREKETGPLRTNIISGNIVNNTREGGAILTTAEKWFDASRIIDRIGKALPASAFFGEKLLKANALVYKKDASKIDEEWLEREFRRLKEIAIIGDKKLEKHWQIVDVAWMLAKRVHGDQQRANGEPYLIHLLSVASILIEQFRVLRRFNIKADRENLAHYADAILLAIALLHDTVEDYEGPGDILDIMRKEFAKTGISDVVIKAIFDGVGVLTKKEGEEDKDFLLRIAGCKKSYVRVIKIADRLHNLQTPRYKSDIKKIKRYLAESVDFVESLEGKILSRAKGVFKREVSRFYTPELEKQGLTGGQGPGDRGKGASSSPVGRTQASLSPTHKYARALLDNAMRYLAPGNNMAEPISGYFVEGWNREPDKGLDFRTYTQLTAIGFEVQVLANIVAGYVDNPYMTGEQALEKLIVVINSLRQDQGNPELSHKGLLVNFMGLENGERKGPLGSEAQKLKLTKEEQYGGFGKKKGESIWQALITKGWITAQSISQEAGINRIKGYGEDFGGALKPYEGDKAAIMKILDERHVLVVFGDNANLSASLGVAIGALLPKIEDSRKIKELTEKMEAFLEKQSEGYRFLYDDSAGMFRFGYNWTTEKWLGWPDQGQWHVAHSDYLGNEFRGPAIFVVVRYRLPQSAIKNLAFKIKSYPIDGRDVSTVAPYDGSAFQMLWPALYMPELYNPGWRLILKNFVEIELDYASRHRLPDILSECYTGEGIQYTGKVGIPEIAVATDPRITNVASLYALGLAYMVAPGETERFLEANWPVIKTLLTEHGPWEGYNIAQKEAIRFQTSAHTLSLILGFVGKGPQDMMRYLGSKGLSRDIESFYQPGEKADLLKSNDGTYHLKAGNIGPGGIIVTIPQAQRVNLSNGTLRIRYRSHQPIKKAVVGFNRKEASPVGVGFISNEAFVSFKDTHGQENEIRIPLLATPALAGINEITVTFLRSNGETFLADVLFTGLEFEPNAAALEMTDRSSSPVVSVSKDADNSLVVKVDSRVFRFASREIEKRKQDWFDTEGMRLDIQGLMKAYAYPYFQAGDLEYLYRLKEMRLRVSDIRVTQPGITCDRVLHFLNKDKKNFLIVNPIVVIRVAGMDYCLAGNHRLLYHRLWGLEEINAKVIDVTNLLFKAKVQESLREQAARVQGMFGSQDIDALVEDFTRQLKEKHPPRASSSPVEEAKGNWWESKHFGVLAPLAALGDNTAAKPFISFIKDILGATFWMDLPLTQTYRDPCPYLSISLFAQNALRYLDRSNVPEASEELAQFTEKEAWWLDDYALFHALLDYFNTEDWRHWPQEISRRDPEALRKYAEQLSEEIASFKYLQWLSHVQRLDIRATARAKGVFLLGDLPMYPAINSADVWSHQELFEFDKTNGAPPDQFSKEGQNWSSLPYGWGDKYEEVLTFWLSRIRHAAKYFDGMRVDHLLGFCGEWVIPWDQPATKGKFEPADADAMAKLGEGIITALAQEAYKSGMLLIGEDLGIRPVEVRAMLDRLAQELPNLYLYNVIGWREAEASQLPHMLITSETHDTPATFVDRVEELSPGDRKQTQDLFRMYGQGDDEASLKDLDSLLNVMLRSGNLLMCVSIQTVFGLSGPEHRYNVPGTKNRKNWTWRLPSEARKLMASGDVQENKALAIIVKKMAKPGASSPCAISVAENHQEMISWLQLLLTDKTIVKGLPLIVFDFHNDAEAWDTPEAEIHEGNWITVAHKRGLIGPITLVRPVWSATDPQFKWYNDWVRTLRDIDNLRVVYDPALIRRKTGPAIISIDFDYLSVSLCQDHYRHRPSERGISAVSGRIVDGLRQNGVSVAALNYTRSRGQGGTAYSPSDQSDEILAALQSAFSPLVSPGPVLAQPAVETGGFGVVPKTTSGI